MKMTQEEFDSIKDLVTLPIELNSENFEEYRYVTNDRAKNGIIANLIFPNVMGLNRKVYEYFDKDIFLKACDIEVDKPIMQVWFDDRWVDYSGVYRVKPKPNYDKEIQSLQDKANANGMKVELKWSKL